MLSEQIQSVFYNENHVGLVFYNTAADTKYRIEIYDTSAKKVSELAFDMEYKEILFDSSGIVIYNDSECMIYDWDDLNIREHLVTRLSALFRAAVFQDIRLSQTIPYSR